MEILNNEPQKLLLHCCCAPCSAAILEWLLEHTWRPTLFYFNPNIFPQEEYLIRKNECSKYAQRLGVPFIDGDYQHEQWLQCVRGLESQPERGMRCLQCFRLRMEATAQLAHDMNFKLFATTLASSRWKDLSQISEAGNAAAAKYEDVDFYDRNWRKGGLQERRRALLLENGFYNQQYCGCEFSMRSL